MKKIMFNDRYGLTDAVISGRKTETRRIEFVQSRKAIELSNVSFVEEDIKGREALMSAMARYKVGDIVAVAQSYKDAGVNPDYIVSYKDDGTPVTAIQSPGWTNKMFTRTDMPTWTNKVFSRVYLMPHQIRITDIRIERLQDISDEDCIKEGIRYIPEIGKFYFEDVLREAGFYFDNPREAFAALIDKVSGRGTWDRNPYVVVYQFELVK